jgi:hypothetical protein
VATRNGMAVFTGRKGKTAIFTPVESYAHFFPKAIATSWPP